MIFAVYRISVTLRRNDDRKIRVQTLFAVGSLLGLLLHSLVDYPMRSASLGVLAGFVVGLVRSEEHTSELQSLMRISYAVLCLKKKLANESSSRNTRSTRH